MKDKEQPVERPAPRPPIYSVAVIEVACRALEVLANVAKAECVQPGGEAESLGNHIGLVALRIVLDGLVGHEKAMRGEP